MLGSFEFGRRPHGSGFFTFVRLLVLLIILGSIATGVVVVVFLAKGAQAIEQHGLKHYIERIWEGPNGQ